MFKKTNCGNVVANAIAKESPIIMITLPKRRDVLLKGNLSPTVTNTTLVTNSQIAEIVRRKAPSRELTPTLS